MAGKDQYSPFAINARPRSDEESTASAARPQSDEERRKRKMKIIAYVAAFAVFQAVVILVFALTVMRVKRPDIKIRSVTVQNPNVGASSFNMTLIAQVTIRNKNFGDYKYENTTVLLTYGGVNIGSGVIPKGKAKARKTRRLNVTMPVIADRLSEDLSSEILRFGSTADVRGKVHLIKMFKRRKNASLNCTMAFNLTNQTIQELMC